MYTWYIHKIYTLQQYGPKIVNRSENSKDRWQVWLLLASEHLDLRVSVPSYSWFHQFIGLELQTMWFIVSTCFLSGRLNYVWVGQMNDQRTSPSKALDQESLVTFPERQNCTGASINSVLGIKYFLKNCVLLLLGACHWFLWTWAHVHFSLLIFF